MAINLTQEQSDAIRANDTNVRIIACAGSGKTTTIAYKIAYLLNPENMLNILPENIIAFTYTVGCRRIKKQGARKSWSSKRAC